jgi:uncharacterized protein YndB with AHSA1/START domain
MSDREIRLQRLIDAPIDVTFHHWTDPGSRRRWCAPEDNWMAAATSDLRVGGAWSVTFGPTAEQMYRIDGAYLEIDPPPASCTARCSGIPMAGRSRRARP